MQHILDRLQREILTWPGMTAAPHRFGGIEFNLGSVEVGHVHRSGMVDIPFNSKIRNQLVAEGLAEPHHLLKDTGWISFYIHSDADGEAALRLFRLSYLFNAARQRTPGVDVAQEAAALGMSDPLRAAFQSAARV
jgi:hypothetical protein